MRSRRRKGTLARVFASATFNPRPTLLHMFCGTTVSLGCGRVTGLFVFRDPSSCNRCMNYRQRGRAARAEVYESSKTGAAVSKKKLRHGRVNCASRICLEFVASEVGNVGRRYSQGVRTNRDTDAPRFGRKRPGTPLKSEVIQFNNLELSHVLYIPPSLKGCNSHQLAGVKTDFSRGAWPPYARGGLLCGMLAR
ncbi:hypothetical protein AUP68_16624 [Ilyonectria robusta]